MFIFFQLVVEVQKDPEYVSVEADILIGTKPLRNLSAVYAASLKSTHNEATDFSNERVSGGLATSCNVAEILSIHNFYPYPKHLFFILLYPNILVLCDTYGTPVTAFVVVIRIPASIGTPHICQKTALF